MASIRCMIIDDEPLALDLMEKYVVKTPYLELIAKCGSAIEAMNYLKDESVDLLFLDIQMPDLSGIAFSKSLSKDIKVIFTTAFEQYALEGFKVDALDYLLKPFSYEEFLKSANKAKEWFDLKKKAQHPIEAAEEYLFVKSEYKLIKINYDDILYFEGLKDYVKIYLKSEVHPILSLMSLKSLESKLPEKRFMRIHRSFIIHLEHIDSIERGKIIIGKAIVPLADGYREKFQAYLDKRT